jgi:hypothetical protein
VDGKYDRFVPIRSGGYRVRFFKDSTYTPPDFVDTGAIASGETVTVDGILKKTPTNIHVVVRDSAGATVSDARVEVTDGNNTSYGTFLAGPYDYGSALPPDVAFTATATKNHPTVPAVPGTPGTPAVPGFDEAGHTDFTLDPGANNVTITVTMSRCPTTGPRPVGCP